MKLTVTQFNENHSAQNLTKKTHIGVDEIVLRIRSFRNDLQDGLTNEHIEAYGIDYRNRTDHMGIAGSDSVEAQSRCHTD